MRLLQPPTRAPRSQPPRHPGAPYDAMLTSEGKALLEQKAEKLRGATLPSLRRAVREEPHDEMTRDAYEDALAELRRVESVLAQARPIPAQSGGPDQVSLGDRITVSFLTAHGDVAEAKEEFLLVHPFEAPLDMHRISVTSPLGRAVLGRQVGDVVSFDAPTRRRAVRILGREPTR